MAEGSKKQSPFQLALFGAFFLFGAIGIVMFALYEAGGANDDLGQVYIWGTLPAPQFDAFLEDYAAAYDSRAEAVQYFYKEPETFDEVLVEALASGDGPDIVLLTNEQIMRNKGRMYVTPYENYPLRDFSDIYIESAEVLLLPEGLIGRPVAVDPLVLYWNRTLLANAEYALPPRQWNELFKMAQRITKRDETRTIQIATVALGEFANIKHAKDILLTMFMQAGGIVLSVDGDGTLQSNVNARGTAGTQPMQDALRFFTEFSNPSKTTYTWNRALPAARDAFIAGDLAMYVGYASELDIILEQNPNLNFDVAPLPQTSGGEGERKLTTARVYAYAVPKIAENVYGASVMLDEVLTTKEASQLLEGRTGLPSPRRDLLAVAPADALKSTFRASAIQSVSWPDPNPDATYAIFAKMSNSVVDGSARMSEAVQRAHRELQVFLQESE